MPPFDEDLRTEQVAGQYQDLDLRPISDLIQLMNEADEQVAVAVGRAQEKIAEAVELIVSKLETGGRLFYIGAGTSGRLGALDAAECPPTFNTPRDMVQAVLAGGKEAMFEAVEHAEDDTTLAQIELCNRNLHAEDVVVGITASGRTPFVLSGMRYARSAGAATISISCNLDAEVSRYADVAIEVETGPEVIMGSTRLKAGTAEKMVLNMLSTATMVRLGKVYGNLMVDLRATNHKLVERAKRIHMLATGSSYEQASETLLRAHGHVKTAILMTKANLDFDSASKRLKDANFTLRKALES